MRNSPGDTSEEQRKLLDEALHVVKVQSFQMARALDQDKIMDGLKHCSTMLSELRTSMLTPRNYYELYMAIFDQMHHLCDYLKDGHKAGRHDLGEMYELVQYAGNIVPRLYLMIAVGSVLMGVVGSDVAAELLRDMSDMSRGVQHPMRGLFLRHFLLQMTKDNLPHDQSSAQEVTTTTTTTATTTTETQSDAGESSEKSPAAPATAAPAPAPAPGAARGTLRDSVRFVLDNLTETNKLWVRMQHQGHSRDREKREIERRDLRLLVGTNLLRLSQMDDISRDMYRDVILPKILEQVVSCHDVIAQEYLMDIIIQTFPAEFQLATLKPFLAAVAKLQQRVNIKQIVISLIDRLTKYALEEANNGRSIVGSVAKASKEQQQQQQQQPQTESADASEPVAASTDEVDDGETVRAASPPPKHAEAEEDPKLFDMFWAEIINMIKARSSLTILDIALLCLSITNLALTCYPNEYDHIDSVLSFVITKMQGFEFNPELHSNQTSVALQSLALAPVKSYGSVLSLLHLKEYPRFVASLAFDTRRAVATTLVTYLLQQRTILSTPEQVAGILALCPVLIASETRDNSAVYAAGVGRPGSRYAGSGSGSGSGGRVRGGDSRDDEEDIAEEQGMLARCIHLLQNDDVDILFQLFKTARNLLAEGGDRVIYTLPPLVFRSLELARQLIRLERKQSAQKPKTKIGDVYKFINMVVGTLQDRVASAVGGYGNSSAANSAALAASAGSLALGMYVLTARSANEAGLEEFCYEFFAQAFTAYEESITDSRAQYSALTQLVNALCAADCLGEDNFDILARKCIQHASKMLKRPDQARALALCAHLYWRPVNKSSQPEEPADANAKWALEQELAKKLHRDDKKMLETLQKALKSADACLDPVTNVELLVEILNKYLHFFEHGAEAASASLVSGLITLIHTNIANLDAFSSVLNASAGGSTGRDRMQQQSQQASQQQQQAHAASSLFIVDGKLAASVHNHFLRTLAFIESRKVAEEAAREVARAGGFVDSSAFNFDHRFIDIETTYSA